MREDEDYSTMRGTNFSPVLFIQYFIIARNGRHEG
jgi:hypothetical protein